MYVGILLKDRILPTCVIKKQHKINQALANWFEYAMFKLAFRFPSCFYERMAKRGVLHQRGCRRRHSDRVGVPFILAFYCHLSDFPLHVNCWVYLIGETGVAQRLGDRTEETFLLQGLLPNHFVPLKGTTVHPST